MSRFKWHIHVQQTISNCIQSRLTTRTCVAEKKTFVVATCILGYMKSVRILFHSTFLSVTAKTSTFGFFWRLCSHIVTVSYVLSEARTHKWKARARLSSTLIIYFVPFPISSHLSTLRSLLSSQHSDSPITTSSVFAISNMLLFSFMQTRLRFLKSNTYSYVCRDFRVTCMQTDARKTFNLLQCYYIITFCMRFGTCVVGVKWLLTLQLSENHITPNLICYLILKLLLTSCLLSCILGWDLLVTIIGHFSFFSCNCSTNKTCR